VRLTSNSLLDTKFPEDPAVEDNTTSQDKAAPATEITAMDVETAIEPAAPTAEDASIATTTLNGKANARRKSGGIAEHKGKKLNKKQSKAKISHIDAKPGDHFFIKLKGYPLWPGIICDESMLPAQLLNNRPVTAARPDGSYRPEYEDGGKKVTDRTFPAMYLSTNEL
jgi:hypothetical protein